MDLAELNEIKLNAWVSAQEQLIIKHAQTQGKFENSPFRTELMGEILLKLDTSAVGIIYQPRGRQKKQEFIGGIHLTFLVGRITSGICEGVPFPRSSQYVGRLF